MSLPWQPVLTRLLPRLRAFPPTLLHSPSRALSTFPPRPSLRPTLLPAQPTSSIISLIRTPFHRPGPQTALHSSRGFFTGAQRGAYYPPNRRADGRRPGWVPETGLVLWKRKFERLPGDWIVWAIIAANAAVYGAWMYGEQVYARFRDPSWLVFLQNNFTASWRNIEQGRIWCALTCCFSQSGTGHIFMNMLSLYFLAPAVIAVTGNLAFLGLYLGGGVLASVCSLAFHRFAERRPNPNFSSHGASGAVYSLLAFYAACFPRSTFLLFFVVPVPAWLLVSGLFAYDTYSAFHRPGGKTDSAGHVGGVAAGLAWFARFSGRF